MLMLRPGDTFAGYRILSLCGMGGIGIVYLAEDTLRRKVALKIVPVCDYGRELEGIRRYIRISSESPELLQIYHAGIEQNCLYYTMNPADPLEGTGGVYVPKTLSALLERKGKMKPSEALDMIRTLSRSLEKLHAAGLIHRDIKPENIIYSEGTPKLCDPGLVCAAESTVSFVGTLGYLPPECFNGSHLNDPQRDVYALGKVFYVAVTGAPAARYPYLPPDMSFSLRRRLWPLLTRVCSTNPRHRFKSVSDFLDAMPQELPNPGRLELFRESFRQWRLAHPLFTPAVLLTVFLLLAAGGTGYGMQIHRQRREAEFVKNSLAECSRLEDRFRERADMLSDQLSDAGETALTDELKRVLNEPSPDVRTRLRMCRSLDEKLRNTVLRLLLPVPEKADVPEVVRISDTDRGLLSSPLGSWLTEEESEDVRKNLEKLEKRVFLPKNRLKPGKDFTPDSSFLQKFVYVPAGVFRNKNGELIRIPYAFWCSDSELRGFNFQLYPPFSDLVVRGDMPMTRMVWNDLLECCYIKTLYYEKKHILPKGFIIRPLYTHEWQWACRGAWSGIGNATAFLKNTSGGIIHPVRFGDPNNLGLYDMIGNVAEITIPDPSDRQAHCADICGGWHVSTTADPDTRQPYLKYQFLPPHVGTRIAVVRDDMDFFDREFWIGESRQMTFQGKRYELLATNRALTGYLDAERICSLLGGHLAVPDSPELLKAWSRAFMETGSFHVFIGGSLKDGVWIRPDGSPYTGVPMPPIPADFNWTLSFLQGRIQTVPGSRTPGVICQWTEEEYRTRTNLERIRKSGAAVHSFQIGNKLYLLVPYPSQNHTARQIASLLGGRLAEMRTVQHFARFRKELSRWMDEPVMLGGIWKYGQWIFPDGTPLDFVFPLRESLPLNSMNVTAPCMEKGDLCARQICQFLLLEFDLE